MAKVDYNPIAPGLSFSARAGAAIDQYNAVIVGASEGLVIESSGTSQVALGFLHDGKADAANDHVTVYISGVVWARAAGAITYGDRVQTAADGEVTAGAAGKNICGIALGVADAANELVPVLITLGTVEET
jgi:hypothetical protein